MWPFLVGSSGKTTYCHGMQQFIKELGRGVAIINLDFANDGVPYKADIDVRDLITLEVLELGRKSVHALNLDCYSRKLWRNLNWDQTVD